MELTRALVEAKAAEYEDEAPFYAVEIEQVETFPAAVASGAYGWRDAEWVVQWYYRRSLGAYPDRQRRAAEDAYDENDFEAVRDALTAASRTDSPQDALDRLTDLSGVDVGVASAFLMFIDPDTAIVVGDREWAVLQGAGILADPVPESVTASDYVRYLEACQALGDRFECSMWTLYQALWQLWSDLSP